METDIFATNKPEIISSEIAQEMEEITEESSASTETEAAETTETTEETQETVYIPVIPEDVLTNETYLNGVNSLVNTIDPLSVNEEVYYMDSPALYSLNGTELPDYAVVYQANGVNVIFPTDYADNIVIADGLLINLGTSYTAGAQIDGYSVDNYLSSEITIPTYHSNTWYQYLQTYGQPYRIVDRYVNYNGYISSSTRDTVYLEWSGGNPWQGFTFDRIAIYLILIILVIMFIFRKGK